ncbi:ABC transporter substrate-binding protein [Thauera butanivorans]|uniref:ABC transporter substrate-binding protein n=1 Tax=Thauera butanivorans TaxID=86174 RepID=UPI000838CB05|nr:ABC transporter substrate-binding protein [Thauera butanivorans]
MRIGRKAALCSLALAACLWGAGPGAASASEPAGCSAGAGQTRQIVDMAGRTVVLPPTIERIATIGSVPVINGYLFALGAGDRIVNGLPPRFTQTARWRLQGEIAPGLAERPVLQGQAGNGVNLETLLGLAPDLVITMDTPSARALETARIPVIVIEWRHAQDIEASMALLGCALDRVQRSEDYLRYFEATLQRVRETLADLAPADRPKVLYFNPGTMATPLVIANWWIEAAGGRSVTAALAGEGSAHYTHEQLLLWNPDVLIVNSPEQVAAIHRDERFARLAAVRHGRVHATPIGAHAWGQRTIEQPLTVLWAAKLLHPDRFAGVDMEGEMGSFYRRFFKYGLTGEEARSILAGSAR